MGIYVDWNAANTGETIKVPCEPIPELSLTHYALPFAEVVEYESDPVTGRQVARVSYMHGNGYPTVMQFFADRLIVTV